jgi:hypothetical protein
MKRGGIGRDLVNILLGACLALLPWVFGMSWDAKSSANASLVGLGLVEATLLGLVVGESRLVRWAKTTLGGWLLVSPFILGFTAPAPSLSAWIVGALVLASADTAGTAFDLTTLIRSICLRYRALTLTPERLIKLDGPEEPPTPERLARQIADSSEQIRRTLLGRPSQPEVEMCALGYQACVEDAIMLASLVRRESEKGGPFRRLRLRTALRRAADSLCRAREAFPPEVLRASHEKRR